MTFDEKESTYNIYRGILHNNASFQAGEKTGVRYRLDCPEYEELAEKYSLSKIAGKGSDLQRAIRLLKYFSPRLTHCAWYDGHIECNALRLLEYSLDNPQQGINCLNKSKILEESCLALGIYARRVRILPYSPYDWDCHVVTEVYDRGTEKWYMLDPTTNGFLVDENRGILSVFEARQRLADGRFVTFIKAACRTTDLQAVWRKNMDLNYYYAKNLFRVQVDSVSQFGETGVWLNAVPLHYSVKEYSMERCRYMLREIPELGKKDAAFETEKQLAAACKRLAELEAQPEPYAVSVECLTEKPE